MAGIVITVLLTILKIILILLLVILALVILVLVLPIRYETAAGADSRKGLESLHAKVRVCALLKIVKVKACFNEGTLSWAVKIFGKVLMSGKEEIFDLKKDQAEAADTPASTEAGTEALQESTDAGTENVPVQAAAAPESTAEVQPAEEAAAEEEPAVQEEAAAEQEPEKEELSAPEADIVFDDTDQEAGPVQPSAKEMAKRRKKEEKAKEAAAAEPGQTVWEKIDTIRDRMYEILDKIYQVTDIMLDPATHRTARRIKQAVFKILGHVLPRKCRVKLTFGTGDPALTGQILGSIYALYPWYADRGEFYIYGDFVEALAYGKLYLEGRIHPVVPAFHAVFLLRDKNIRKLIFGRKKKKAA
ncbi:MAG: DUF2953 domain-containing protein [Lachnospiraceae bacterium]|nr:DUF2953 domain-containing protein [Lachnospiraceae bacterium]